MLHNMSLVRFILTTMTTVIFSSITLFIFSILNNLIKNIILIDDYSFSKSIFIFILIFLNFIIISYNNKIQKKIKIITKIIYKIKY